VQNSFATSTRTAPPLRPSLAQACVLLSGLLLGTAAHAQVSLTSAVDLALSNSPRVKLAESDVVKAKAALDESRDVYVPVVNGTSAGLGYSYGFPLGTPTIFSFTAQSLVFSYSQKDYIRSASAGLSASGYALKEAREQVAEDTAITYLTLSRDQQERAALAEEGDYATRLQQIVKDRLDAGQDNAMEYTRARRTVVQIRLQLLQMEDTIAQDADHLARLVGMPGTHLQADPGTVPAMPTITPGLFNDAAGASPVQTADLHASDLQTSSLQSADFPDSAGVAASFATARAKRQQAFGDARYTLRPQISFGAQYSRFSTYNNTYVTYYPSVAAHGLSSNAVGFALNISVPIFDAGHHAKARESLADAVHAEQQALIDRDQYREGRLKLQRSMSELSAHAELAQLDRDLADQQLQVVLAQLQTTATNAPLASPKDEQNARIQERQRFLDMIEAQFQLRQASIHLLKQNGGLLGWLTSPAAAPAPPVTPSNSVTLPPAP
jgi:outer membrane protein TolC